MLRIVKLLTGLLISVALFSSIANAQDDRRRTTINFEDELIQGELKKPELLYLLQRKQFNFKKLIRLRKNFLPEMERTSETLQRGRSE